MRLSLLATVLALAPYALAQGEIPPYQVGQTNPLPGLQAGSVAVSSVQQIHMIHLPADPPNVFLCSLTVTGLSSTSGGVGGSDFLTGSYDVLTDTFTPNNDAAALNAPGTEFGLMFHHSGLYASFDRLPGPPQLAMRPSLNSPWQLVGSISGLPSQSYYDPSLGNVGGTPHLFFVFGIDIAMAPIDLNNGNITGPITVVARSSRAGSTANSPTPIVDSAGEVIGLSHHDVLSSDNDHYLSLDLDANTPAVLFNDTSTWTNNGCFVGGRFIDAESSPSPYHPFSIDAYWLTGGRADVGAPMEIRAFIPPTTSSDLFVSFLLVGGGFLPTGQAVPPLLGELGLTNILVDVPMGVHNNMNGEALLTLNVPNNGSLSGGSLPVQAVTLNATAGVLTLGNTAAMTIN